MVTRIMRCHKTPRGKRIPVIHGIHKKTNKQGIQPDSSLPLTKKELIDKHPLTVVATVTALMAGQFDCVGKEPLHACKNCAQLVLFMFALIPEWKEIFLSWPGPLAKRDVVGGMCLMLRAAPGATPPPKTLSGLMAWCKKRWEKDSDSLLEWVAKVCTSSWKLELPEGTMTYVPGRTRPYPAMSVKAMKIDIIEPEYKEISLSKDSDRSSSSPQSPNRDEPYDPPTDSDSDSSSPRSPNLDERDPLGDSDSDSSSSD